MPEHISSRPSRQPGLARGTSRPVAPPAHTPRQNGLLAALAGDDYKRLLPHLECVPLPLGQVLYEPGDHLAYAYFPTTSLIALLYVTEAGASSEFAVVGNEGMVGIALFMGGDTHPSRAMAGSAGNAYRLRSDVLRREFERGGLLQHLLLHYTQARMAQTAQSVVCNRFHTLEQQLCRWLLSSLDRLPSHELAMTQELIATMLGVRREGVTAAIGHLQTAGVIDHNRGHIIVLDRPQLEARVCECYAVVKREFDRLLPAKPRAETASRPQPEHARFTRSERENSGKLRPCNQPF